MTKSDAKLVTGLFKTRAAADAAMEALVKRGYERTDVTVLMSDATRTKEFAFETGSKAAEGAGIGGAVGGTLGAALAGIAAIGTTVMVGGIGLVVAGPLAAALAGAGAGGAVGGLIGLLIGAGIPEQRAKVYEAGLRQGGILLGVEARPGDEADALEKLFEEIGAAGVRQD